MRPTSSLHAKTSRKAFAYVLAMVLLCVFAVLATGMATTSNLNVQKTHNYESALGARLAAEGGLQYASASMRNILSEGYWTGQPEAVDMVDVACNHLAAVLAGSCAAVVKDASDAANPVVTVSNLSLPNGDEFAFTVRKVTVTEGGEPVDRLRLAVTGTSAGLSRTVRIDYTINEDTSIMSYAIASRPRVILRGDVQIDGDICSNWTRTSQAPPFDINPGENADISGDIKTVLSKSEFEEYDSQDQVHSDLHDKLRFNEPAMEKYTVDDFDTTPIIDWMNNDNKTNTLPHVPYSQRIWEGFPDADPSRWIKRPFFHDTEFNWTYIPSSRNPHFVGCTFKGITYIETTNNVVFEDCTFEGPVVTGVASKFRWTTDALYFKGATEFKPTEIAQYLDGCTLLAPNFNVNIGDFYKEGQTSTSKVTGILVGGIVDIRDGAVIEGTIMSMANLDHITGSSIWYYGTNLGYWEGDAEEGGGSVPMTTNIRITPQPDSTLPIGIRKRYTLKVLPGTYAEVTP